MRRALLALVLGCLFATAAAHAQVTNGVALRWNHCHGEGTGQANRAFACDTNAGFEELTGSFTIPVDMMNVSGNEIVVDVSTGFPVRTVSMPGPPLPDWWKFGDAGTCRQAALSASFVADPANAVCQDWSAGQAVGGLAAYRLDYAFLGTARIVAVVAVPGTSLQTLHAGTEYYSFTLRISHARTVGTGACSGCLTPMYLVLRSIEVTTSTAANDMLLYFPLDGIDANVANWNQTAPVPTRRSTWGAVKSLYR
jgi:hypothetical protein